MSTSGTAESAVSASKSTVTLRIRRYDPSAQRSFWSEYVLSYAPSDRILDLLNQVKGTLDSSLTYRRSCNHGVCGSCAMHINGVNQLACKVRVKELGSVVRVEPLPGLPVFRDLVVDMDSIFDAHAQIRPWVTSDINMPKKEQLQLPTELETYIDAARCIMCGACTTACPLYSSDNGYLGPAALVQAYRFCLDNRDSLYTERLAQINNRTGVWRCRTAFSCTAACPQGIPVTTLIQTLKRRLW